ncbi:uncharacterized protein LOC142560695 [Dermacentor variabilis]|uniref:uncharacterized protein LOC142560695 n=1 Tax=Dermacentor variabilis TaxID=34621 RepID=UPI003F5B84C0
MEMTAINQPLYAKRRTSSFETVAPCFSLSKLYSQGVGFMYNVTYIFPRRILNTFTTRLTTLATPPHTVANAVRFKVLRDGDRLNFKVMYINPAKSCIILIRYPTRGERQCILLQTGSTVDSDPPVDCQTIYSRQCSHCTTDVYYFSCKSVLVTNIAKEGTHMIRHPGRMHLLPKGQVCK